MLRYDATTDSWVVFAPHRARRPHDYRRSSPLREEEPGEVHATCPFCPGQEALTPPEILATPLREGQRGSYWSVRIVPNLYPALRPDQPAQPYSEEPLHKSRGGHGYHEVVVESPKHNRFLAFQPLAQVETVLGAIQTRARTLLEDLDVAWVIPFKNHGVEAGASLQHPHWQLIGTPIVPELVLSKMEIAARYYAATGANLMASLRDQEIEQGDRILERNDRFVAYLPFASRFPFETWIVPRFWQASFLQATTGDLVALAEVLVTVLKRIHQGLGNPAFNLTLDLTPRGAEERPDLLWTLQILPRLSTPAGFEFGSGMSINTMYPEAAAEYLRAQSIAEDDRS